MTASVRRAPGPSGDDLAAHRLGRVDDEHLVGLQPLVERAPGAFEQQRVAGGEHVSGPVGSSPPRWTDSTTRSPLSVTMPGNTGWPISGERGGTTTSATPA